MATTSRRFSSQVLIGAIIVLVGLALLAETTDVYDASWLLTYVPSLFVLVGLYALVVSGFRNVVGSLLVIVVAGAWQLVALGSLSAGDVLSLWPLLLVLVGLSVILGQYRARAHATDDDHPTAVAFFGGSEQRSTSSQFDGADLTALFGGTTLDLRDVAIPDPPAHVSATVMFGGVELVVPREWNVRIDVLPLFGGVSDERLRGDREGDGTTADDTADLVVTGVVLFGGLEVKD